METKRISLHRALSELKMLGERIQSATYRVVLARANRKSNEKIEGMSIDEYKKKCKVLTTRSQVLFNTAIN
ncbi:hypothetical protein B857_01381 [Solibacillus isronensis B3W22]|uniref:Uncharacterized protein n=1 Tax=Solibacillus isronensis B3W22 TaxID=1224748 RepID=K1KNV4_9BACL|nr:hypothetical protein [Solibacillus isronensis]EKB45765.1 hypothetical protein B857_01381 [Solibacillus isronensis B3W22]